MQVGLWLPRPSPAIRLPFWPPSSAGVRPAGKETGERPRLRKRTRGPREGVREDLPLLADGESHLPAPRQDTRGARRGLRAPASAGHRIAALGEWPRGPRGPPGPRSGPASWESRTCASQGGSPQTLHTSRSTRNHGDQSGRRGRVLGRIGERIGLAALGLSWAQQGLTGSRHSGGTCPPSPDDLRAGSVCSENRITGNRSRRRVSRGPDSPARLGPDRTRGAPGDTGLGLRCPPPSRATGGERAPPGNVGRSRVGSGCCSARFQATLGCHAGHVACGLGPRT